jgi:putative ABC transport system permease protein
MQTLWQDVRYGLRMLTRSPGFTVIGVVVLALGIGANTAIFSVADAFLLKPLPFPQLDRLVAVLEQAPNQTLDTTSVSPANFQDWKKQAHSFEPLAASAWDEVNLSGAGTPEKVQGFLVTANFFETVGVKPLLGRAFLPEEEQPGHDQAVLLSYGLWQRHFGADPSIVGKTVRLDSRTCTVVGVMGKGYNFPTTAEIWLPLALQPKDWSARNSHYLEIVTRLKPGVTVQQAQAEMTTIARRLSDTYPQTNGNWRARVMTMRHFAVGDYTWQYTLLLFAAVGLVLLIACANVANLQFARATGRLREVAIRRALGASRWRIVRQLLMESVLLAFAAAALGLLLAEWGIELILSNMPPDVAKFIVGWDKIRLDGRALAFTVAVAVIAGIIAGLAPALQGSAPNLNEALKEGGRGSSAGRSRSRLRSALVVSQVALAVVLLVGAGLMVRGFRALLNVNQGFSPESLLTMRIALPDSKYATPAQLAAFYDQALQKLAAIPGAQAVTSASGIPFGHSLSTQMLNIEGSPPINPSDRKTATSEVISPNYFRLMHIPLREGREFGESDGADSPRVAIISQSLAQRYWPGQSPLGRRIKVGTYDSENPWMTVIGVVGDVKYEWTDLGPPAELYRPYRQSPRDYCTFVLRSNGNPMALAAAARGQIASIDPDQPIFDVKPMDRVIMETIMGIAYVAVMMAVIGVMALILSSAGIFGVMAYSVSERTHEIGVRMALGAQARDVMRMILGRGILLAAAGLLIGLPVSMALARLLSSLIFGVSAADVVTFAGASIVLGGVALLACYLPARRATRVDPMVALRYE